MLPPTVSVEPSNVRLADSPQVFVDVAYATRFAVAAFGRISVDQSGAVDVPPERR